ncbi:VOC family protein [Nocardia sp. CA-120079]|uniref:VOC family protein n=1 Tax=Nocardia sp. CA-120079 TaxID=3239974 RepID=UPI003D995E95
MSGVLELGYLGFGVSDPSEWKKFAAEVLGLEYVPGPDENTYFLRMDYQHHRIIVTEDPADDLTVIGLRVADAEALSQMQDNLAAAEIPFVVGTEAEALERHVLGLIKLEDPAGIPLEIYYGPELIYSRPFHPGRPMHGKFATGAAGMGHCFISGDAKESLEFYRILGMRGGTEYKLPSPDGDGHIHVVFMRGAKRQHSIAFGAPLPKRIDHFMLQATDFDDLGFTHDIVRERKIPVTETLGKHSNDQMYSFYFKTPSGFGIEYGHGGRDAFETSEYYATDVHGHLSEAPGSFGRDEDPQVSVQS